MNASGDPHANASPGVLGQVQMNLAGWLAVMRRRPHGHVQPRLWIGPAALMIGAVAIAAVIAAVMVTVDATAIIAARRLPDTVHRVFGIITGFGKSGWFLWPIGLMLVASAMATPSRLGRIGASVTAAMAVRLTFLLAAIALPGLFTAVVKNVIGRARPFVGGSANPFLYHPFAWTPAYASLPSGHTTTAVAAAVAIGAMWPRSGPYVWLYALVIAISRVIITAHHPSDVIAGAVVGAIGAVLVRNWFAARRLVFAVAPDGYVHAMPGPSWRRLKRVAARLLGQ